ncbi:MAG: metallophosphoesterase family protein, partial [Phycisphaeraceae bacterium]
MHVGDCVERGQRWDEWKVQLFDPGRPYLAKGPIYPARGNHDGGPYFRTLFDRDADLFTDFRFGDVHVFVMDSQSSTGGARRTQQLEWLETGLASSDARWKIVTLHHPMVHSPATEPLFGVDDFLNIVTEQEADFVLTGHYHVYQRLLPIGLEDKKPVLHVTTGGGGGNMGSRTMSPLIVTDSMKHHHLRFTVDGDKLEMIALLNDGTEIDRYTLIKTADNQYQPEVMQRSVPLALAQHVRLFYHYLTQPNVRLDEYGAALIDADAAEPGARVTLRLNRHLLDAEKIPADAALLLRPIDGEPWTLDAQTLDILADEWTFTATAPDDLAIDEGGKVRPSLRMHVVLRVGEFEFEPEPVDVIV